MPPPKVLTDTSLWLHNKLGTSNDLWSGGSICSQLNPEVLRSIRDCFNLLQSQVKIKLILSFLHIQRRNIDEWKAELDEILEIALEDSDQWVSMVAELLKKYPMDGTINFDIEQNSAVFTDLVGELRKIVRKHSDKHILPLECLYLNKNALNAQVGHISQPSKHFTLKRKPKSAALRAELLQKSTDAASNTKTKISTSVPIRCRGITNDSRPMTSIPSLAPFRKPNAPVLVNRSFKKQSAIQFLDIMEQPLGRDAKRKKAKEDKEKEDKEKEVESTITPDYAAGLTSMIPPSPAPVIYAPPATPASSAASHDPIVPSSVPSSVAPARKQPPVPKAEPPPPTLQPQPQLIQQNVQQQPQLVQQQQQQPQQHLQPVLVQMNQMAQPQLIPAPQLQQQQQRVIVQQRPQLIQQPQQILIQQRMPVIQQPMAQQQHQVPVAQQPQQQQRQFVQQQPVQGQGQQFVIGAERKPVQVTPELRQAVSEVFRGANRATKPEKALIVGFICGSKENPCPQLGNIVTIKLGDHIEKVTYPDGSESYSFVEMHYQMNYATGEGKKLKKPRPLTEQEIQQLRIQQQQMQQQQLIQQQQGMN